MIKKQKARRTVKNPHIKKDDKVKVISGEFKGKDGRVFSVNPEKATAVIEGINMIKKHVKHNKNVGKGGIVDKEGPIALSNLALIGEDGKLTHAKYIEQGDKRVRINAKTKEEI